ncbi:MAG TPA: methylated-DNA--[protein]-cysteine S-methyltransferase [Actinomycetes bacterium]
MTTYWTTTDSPVGPLLLTSDGRALTRVLFDADPDPDWSAQPCELLDRAVEQLREYFAGERTEFDLPLAPDGTPFQRRVWEALRTIPYAETISYRQLADRVGNPSASRAVGLANGRNPISLVVPCHRVIGADGSLTGYGGGLDRKRTLLDLERRVGGVASPQDQLTLL